MIPDLERRAGALALGRRIRLFAAIGTGFPAPDKRGLRQAARVFQLGSGLGQARLRVRFRVSLKRREKRSAHRGVDAFLIGSEMRGLTQIRSAKSVYSAVVAFKALASDVQSILGPATKISQGMDRHHPYPPHNKAPRKILLQFIEF